MYKTPNCVLPLALSFLVPGLGQFIRGQVFRAILWFFLTIFAYCLFLVPGFIVHVMCLIDAYKGKSAATTATV